MVQVKIKVLPGGHIPKKQTDGAAAWDCYARIRNDFPPVGIKEIRDDQFGNKIPLGFAMELPKGYHAEIYPRSSLGTKTRLRVSNSVGIIDSDYRGEVCVVLDCIGAVSKKWAAQGRLIPTKQGKYAGRKSVNGIYGYFVELIR